MQWLTKRALVALLPWSALAAAYGCGPSYQTIHEGDSRFEHCYSLDEVGGSSMEDKAKCWHDYRSGYAFGQTRDRLSYAERREKLLQRSQVIPTDEAMMEAAPGQVALNPNAPVPTNAFVPPPQMLPTATIPNVPPVASLASTTTQSVAPQVTVSAAGVDAPGAPCVRKCEDAWRACEKTCISASSPNASSAAKAGCSACGKTHKTCMAGCFR